MLHSTANETQSVSSTQNNTICLIFIERGGQYRRVNFSHRPTKTPLPCFDPATGKQFVNCNIPKAIFAKALLLEKEQIEFGGLIELNLRQSV